MSNILIELDFALKSIARNRAYVMEIGSEEADKRMACYNPSSFFAGVDYGMKLAQKILSSLPIAYNVDKVVEQLVKEMECAEKEMEECTFKGMPFYDTQKGYAKAMYKAIEIVRKGGVE